MRGGAELGATNLDGGLLLVYAAGSIGPVRPALGLGANGTLESGELEGGGAARLGLHWDHVGSVTSLWAEGALTGTEQSLWLRLNWAARPLY